MVASLLDHGAQSEARDPGGRTPLIVAVWLDDKACLELLLAHKADVNAKDNLGSSALHYAANVSHWEQGRPPAVPQTTQMSLRANMVTLAQLLLANGADVNAVDKDGKTPLGIALERQPPPGTEGADTMVELLRKHGGVANLPDFSSVRIGRKDSFQPIPVFERDTNSLNSFTLLEVVANFYANNPVETRGPVLRQSLPFPDFSKVRILRPVPGKLAERKEITIDLLTDGVKLDCSKDTQLQFGDIVDLPQREHPLSDSPVGLTFNQSRELQDCLRRKVIFMVKGEPHPIDLVGVNFVSLNFAYLSRALGLPEVQSILRSSSDLSQVHVKRTEPNGQVKDLTEAVLPFWNGKQPLSNDIWLRNGDIVEVPSQ